MNGTPQATEAASKLDERFGARERWQERRELLRCVAEESFRASSKQRDVYNQIATSASIDAARFEAVCVSTCLTGSGLAAEECVHGGRAALWIKVSGLDGLRCLAGET